MRARGKVQRFLALDLGMPTLTDQELSALIDAGDLGLITIDTNILHRFGYDLEAASLLALGQFAKSPITFVLPDIIAGEVKGRMVGNAISATAQLRTALRAFRKARRPDSKMVAEAERALGMTDDITADVTERWNEFVAMTAVETIAAGDLLDGDTLVSRYLETKAPFETKEDKKAEFPDAIALLELEARGERDQKYVLAISKDKGWSAYATDSAWIIVRDDLPTALGFFHRADNYVVGRAISMLGDTEHFVLADELQSELVRFVDNLNPDIQAHSYLFHEVDFLGAAYEGHEPVEEGDVTIIDSDETSVTLAFDLTLKVEISAEFAFSVHDSIDGDYVPLGSTEETRVVDVGVHVVAQVGRESGPEDGAMLLRVEAPRFVPVEFGEVEPDMRPDDED